MHSNNGVGCSTAGQALWREVLKNFWAPFEQVVSQTSGISITEVIDVLDPLIGKQFFPPQVIITSRRACSMIMMQLNNWASGRRKGRLPFNWS